MSDFDDAFADDDPAARERAARRAEREARRLERQRTLADKVRSERDSEPAASRPPPSAGVPPPAPSPPTRPAPATAPVHTSAETPPGVLWRRRIAGLALLAAAAGLVAFGAITLADRIDGADDPAPVVATPTKDVTIPEGYDRTQIAEVAKDAGVKGDYLSESKASPGFDPARYGAEGAESLEGFLFPATYELKRNSKAGALVSRQLDAFADRIKGIDMSYAESKNLTVYDVVIIASMIEREVQVPSERPLVAAVIYNRLSNDLPLQIDATVRFASGNFSEPLKESELQSDSPYNTYTNSDLPPGPIGNPGEDALKAAAKPAKENYLFYVVKPGTCGEHVFTADQGEFEAAVEAYRAAQAEAGGSPTEC